MAVVRGGHISVNAGPGGNECVCGGAGCAESEIGSLSKNAEKYPGYSESSFSTYHRLNYQILFREAQQNNAPAAALLAQNLRYLGVSLVNLAYAFDPEKVILAGAVMNESSSIIPQMNAFITENLWTDGDYPEVMVAEHKETAALLGMHALFTQRLSFI